MRNKFNFAIQVGAALIAFASFRNVGSAQNPPAQQTPGVLALTQQLKDDYKVGKPNEPGNVLVVQQAGVVGVPAGSPTIPQSKYQLGVLHPPSSSSTAA